MNYSIYSGAGNDFVIINNIDGNIPFKKQKELTIKICNEQFPDIDGVIYLEKPDGENNSLRMNYYNCDGSYGAMCGNGARCISQFAIDEGIIEGESFNLEAVNKIYRVQVTGENIIKVYFPPPGKIELNIELERPNWEPKLILNYIELGADHIVIFTDDEPNKSVLAIDNLDQAEINVWGSDLRYDPKFQPGGANVNFAEKISDNKIRIRTYERGVERETLACGTGIISTAIVSSLLNKVKPPVKLLSQSNEWLTVDFNLKDNVHIENLSLEGPAKKISIGII